MSENWSWACVIGSKTDKAGDVIIKASLDLSTCPEAPYLGQVDRYISPLNIKPRQDANNWTFEEFEERAAIMEFDAGLSRIDAETMALKNFRDTITEGKC